MSYSCQPPPCTREAYYYKIENNRTTCAEGKINSKGDCTLCSDPANYELKRNGGRMVCMCKKGLNGETRVSDTQSNVGGVGQCKIQCPSGPTSPYALGDDGKCRLKETESGIGFLPQINTGKTSEGDGSQPVCDTSKNYYYSITESKCVKCPVEAVSALKEPPQQCCDSGYKQEKKNTLKGTTYKNSCPTPAQGYRWREGYC